jgi:hypothetical protein
MTYAAVAAKTSTRRACVAIARQPENKNVNTQTRPSLIFKFLIKDKTIMDINGANEENIVPSTLVTLSILLSS